ncbi:hypothetical protein TIFTF001_039684 [Ficus carica]|uniref:Retrotransposon gag domain-containing protein n=1 Tax=Ficus carica TaxID=3494 RepID=A0AA88EAC8_FICCA|nr:hypothetical protein TIFTF001_039684 [Ficus carica]
MNLVPNPGRIEEDREVLLAFWGIEPRIFDGTHGAVALAEWLYDIEILFRLCHVGAYIQVMLASRRLVGEARAWWLSIGDLEDMYMRRYVSYVASWLIYSNEFMGHYNYYQWIRDAMLPYIPQDRPMIQAIHILRSGLPPEDNLTNLVPPEVNQDVPQNSEVPLAPVAPAGEQANPPIVREDLLYERFRRMKAFEFEGLPHPNMCLNSVVTTRRCANNELDVAKNNLVNYDNGSESDDGIDDIIL